MGRRVLALAIDLLLVMAGSYVVWFAFSGSAASALLLVPLLLSFVIDVPLQGRSGWTPGKRALGLRCVHETSGDPPGRARAMLRYALWVIDGAGGALAAFFTEGHRRLGDMAAHTVVVDAGALDAWRAGTDGSTAAPGAPRNPYGDGEWNGGGPPSAADWGQGP